MAQANGKNLLHAVIRKTLANAKDTTQCGIAAVANVSPSDDRFLALLNLATQNLVQTGEMFYGLHQEINFCVTSGCIVLPRQVAAVETAAVCGHPISVRNRWFQYLPGVGIHYDSSCSSGNCCAGPNLLDQGNTVTFSDIIPDAKKIKVYADVEETAGAKILIQGYDDNGQWITTETSPGSGVWIDGEYVAISTTPQTSTKFFSSVVGVQKPITNGVVRLYEYDTVALTQRAIAIYESDETNPSYRKMLIPNLGGGSCVNDDGEDTTQVTVMAKLEFIPVRNDLDWLLIGNFSALESEVQSILKRRNNLADESLTWHALAVQTLRNEFRHYAGRGVVNPMRMQPRNLAGAGVRNLI